MKLLASLFLGTALVSASGADLPPINSPTTADYFSGKFIWGDLFTADPAAAEKFYTALFGWNSATIERVTPSGKHEYIVLSVDDRPIAGIALRPAQMKDEVHGRWVGYVSVPDVSKALAAATAGGGRVLFPLSDLAQRGTQAILADPNGALLGLMHSSTGDPGEYLPEPGDWTWSELFTRGPEAAGRFYQAVLGYDVIPDTRSTRPDAFVLTSGGYSRASVAALSGRPNAHPSWLLFVRVASVKETVARAVSLGGRVLVAPSDAPTEYWRAVIADPAGAHIGVVELEESPKAAAAP